MYRVEDKYVISGNRLWILEQHVAALLPVDSLSGEAGYKVSSLYFDDRKDSMLKDTIDGNPFRDKYRIRIYDDSFATIKLEVKRKKYNRVLKISSEITEKELWALMSGETIRDENNLNDARTLFNLAIRQGGLAPKVIVTYERKAYVYEAGNVRITFDRNIRASDRYDLFGKQDVSYDFPEASDTVLEVKYDEFIPRFIMQVLETGNMLQTSNSKYGICREICERKRKNNVS